ncbi:unnamed protein product [Caenorhabditis angaria]|uniref:Uncharacterized protein n=1 Tax=Caenorhabditis angaria TaxID=860376 RepID=A0A9P1J1I4_9PELO|nr:unnamed protein product [Caenorhabditis angaria]
MLYGQHCITSVCLIVYRIVHICDNYNNYVLILQLCSFIRVWGLSICFMALPLLIIERYFATIHILDYEKTDRVYISRILITGCFLLAFLFSYIFHKNEYGE